MADLASPGLLFGQIFRTKLYFDNTNTSRNKFLIIVGDDRKRSKALFFLTSSQKDKFPPVEIVTKNIIEIKAGEMPCFTADVTVIDCRTVHSESYVWFQDRIKKGSIVPHGELPKEYQDRIKQIAFGSPLISQGNAKIIFNF